MAIHTAWK